jgi:hypothetical protein
MSRKSMTGVFVKQKKERGMKQRKPGDAKKKKKMRR